MSAQTWWFVARASGIVAWLMLTASVIWGTMLASRAFPRHRKPAWLLAMHRWLAGLTMSFMAIHMGALVADSYVSFDLAALTVPGASEWKSGPVALGVVAMWLLVAVQLTSLAVRKLPRRTWHRIHLASYLAFWLTCLHAAFAGTDTSSGLYMVSAVASIVAVAAATMFRIADRRSARPTGAPARPRERV